MDDAGGVGGVESGGDLAKDFEAGGERVTFGVEGELVVEGFAFDELHGDDIEAVDGIVLIDGYDVGVIEGRGGVGFTGKAAAVVGRDEAAGNYFEGDGAAELLVGGFVDGPHAAFAKLAGDLVVGEKGADGKRVRSRSLSGGCHE